MIPEGWGEGFKTKHLAHHGMGMDIYCINTKIMFQQHIE